MAWVPFSLLINKPLLPRRVTLPSAVVIQSNFSQSPAVARLQVMAMVPFSDDTNLALLRREILPPPASITVKCSVSPAVVRVQVMAVVPFSPLTKALLKPLSDITVPKGGLPPVGGVVPPPRLKWV